MSVASTVNFEHISCFILTVIIVEFKQINAGWVCEHISFRQEFYFSNCEKCIVLWAGKTCWAPFSSLFTQIQVPK